MNKLQPTGGLPQVIPDQRPTLPAAKELRPVAVAVPVSSGRAVVRDVSPAPAAQSAKPLPSDEQVKKITDELQRRVNAVTSELEFTLDQTTGRLIVKVMDSRTKEVIMQIPSDQMLELGKDLDRFQQGLLLNRKA
jgi:flagellar protein FlaG